MLQFGQLHLHKTSIDQSVPGLSVWMKKASQTRYANAFDNLDKAGMDVFISGGGPIYQHGGQPAALAMRGNDVFASLFNNQNKKFITAFQLYVEQGNESLLEKCNKALQRTLAQGLTYIKVDKGETV